MGHEDHFYLTGAVVYEVYGAIHAIVFNDIHGSIISGMGAYKVYMQGIIEVYKLQRGSIVLW